MIGKLFALPVRIVNLPFRIAEDVVSYACEGQRMDDNSRSVSLFGSAIANAIEDGIDDLSKP